MTDITQPTAADAPTAPQSAERDPFWFLGALMDIKVASELALPPISVLTTAAHTPALLGERSGKR